MNDDMKKVAAAKDGDCVPVSEEYIKTRYPVPPVEIKPGLLELDVAIAKAIGWSYRLADRIDGEVLGWTCWHDPAGKPVHNFPPRFSTDLNAAFEAAQIVRPVNGMFEVRQQEDGFYAMFGELRTDVYYDVGNGAGSTPALAICAAILKFMEED